MSDGLSTDLDQVTESPEIPAAQKTPSQEDFNRAMQARLAREREKHEEEISRLRAQMQQSVLPSGVGGQGLSREEIEAIMESKMQGVIEKAGRTAVAQKLFTDFNARITAATEQYPDLMQKMTEFGIAEFPELVQLSLSADNTAAVMQELIDHPSKANNISLLYKRSPHLALKEIAKMSNSIKENESAKAPRSKEPLSQIKPTATAVDNGMPSVRDLMKQYHQSRR